MVHSYYSMLVYMAGSMSIRFLSSDERLFPTRVLTSTDTFSERERETKPNVYALLDSSIFRPTVLVSQLIN